ncbi:MAG: hypothetical protein ACREBJ_03630, partial [Nitrosotalea sp.]
IQSDVVKHGSDCLISFRSMGASLGLMSDYIFNAIEKLFTYKICAFTEPTKGSILSPKNMPEILSNALNYDDNTRCFLLRNYEKIQEIDLANVALICAVALGTNHPVLEGLDTSDWFSLLTKFTDVLAVANSNPHENIWRPCFPFLARVPNKDTTVQSARDALCKLDTCREDIVLLVGDAHPALVTQVENEAFANGAVKPLAYQQFIAGIKDENANIFAGRFRSLDILKTPIPNFDKSREMG